MKANVITEEIQRKDVTELPDGTYKGIQSGYVFVHDGNQYMIPHGVKGLCIDTTITIKDHKITTHICGSLNMLNY
jgi:hypothetical protein